MNKEMLDILNELSKKPTTELALSYMEVVADNLEKDKEIEIMKKYFQMIIDLGYDYDGFNSVEDLKGLIDSLCKYASLGKECNTTESIYVNRDKKYNILNEELKEGK